MAPATDVRLERVTKRFHDVIAVDDLSLEINRGEFFSMLGPSGCGKTTTLRMIGGFEESTAGTIFLGDTDVTGLPPFKRDVNTVFQSYALFEHLDVRRNVGFGLRRKGVDKAAIDKRVADMLELVELGDRAKERPSRLSGGQRQRVALARALINEPKVLLLDEPLAALDLKLRRAMQAELKSIQREVGITFLFVTHDQDEALSMSDRVAIMNQGVVEQCGTPEDVYERPTSIFAAGFIGTSNLMTGSWSGGCVAVTPDVLVPAPGHQGSAEGDSVSVTVRPEKIWLTELTPEMYRVPGTIVATSYHGATTQYLVSITSDLTLTVLEQNLPRMRAEERWNPGDRVEMGWLPEHTVVLR